MSCIFQNHLNIIIYKTVYCPLLTVKNVASLSNGSKITHDTQPVGHENEQAC